MYTIESREKVSFSTGAKRNTQAGKGRFDCIPFECLWAVAKHYEGGAEIYGDHNWKKGIPSTRFLSSALRHICQYALGLRDEDHLSAAVFNVWGIKYNEMHKKACHDLEVANPEVVHAIWEALQGHVEGSAEKGKGVRRARVVRNRHNLPAPTRKVRGKSRSKVH